MTVIKSTFADLGLSPSLVVGDHLRQGRQVLMLRGEVERQTVPLLERRLQSLDPSCEIELDLDQVEFMDVAGAVLLTQTATKFYEHGGRMRLSGLSPTATRVLQLLGAECVAGVRPHVIGGP